MNRSSAAAALAMVLLPTHLALDAFRPAVAAPPPALILHQGTVPPRSNLAGILDDLIEPVALHEIVTTALPAYDLGRVQVGKRWSLALEEDGRVRAFTYEIDELNTLRLSRWGDELSPELIERDYERRTETASGIIEHSLFLAIDAAGEDDQLALELAEIFAWDVDFNTEIQKGDSFRVAVEKLYLDGEFRRYGHVLAAEFARGSRVHRAVRFDSGRGPGYYAPDGTPLRKAFLRSPLRFRRISSRFTYRRRHPITKKVRPHLAVDYAADRGTPVTASADGVVREAGWMGGLGKGVRIKHANGYETIYGHLSRIRVKRGQRVAQGKLIGNVGSTGVATGPHLDYRMKRNGKYVNPLTVQVPAAEPIPDSELTEFARVRTERMALLPEPASPLRRVSP